MRRGFWYLRDSNTGRYYTSPLFDVDDEDIESDQVIFERFRKYEKFVESDLKKYYNISGTIRLL
jgi:hypothetical protein